MSNKYKGKWHKQCQKCKKDCVLAGEDPELPDCFGTEGFFDEDTDCWYCAAHLKCTEELGAKEK